MDSRLFWLALAAFVGSAEGGLIAGLLPSISEDLGVTIGQAGLVMVGYSLAYAIGIPLLAVVLGGVGRRRVLAGAELGLAVCALLMAVAPLFPMLVAVRTVLAVCAGTFTGTAMATAAMIAAPGQRGRALQIVAIGQSLAVLLGVPLGAYVATHFDWRLNYVAIAVMAASASVALYLGLPRGLPGDAPQSIRERVSVLRNPGVAPALWTTLLFMLASFPIGIYIGPMLKGAELARDALPIVLLANGVGAVAASFTAGRVADLLGNRRTVSLAVAVMVVGLIGLVMTPHLPLATRLPAMMLIFAVQGYVGWGYWIAHCSEMAHLAPRSVTVAISLDMAALNIGMATAAGVGGVIVDHWGANTLPYVGLPIGIAALVAWLRSPKAPNGPVPDVPKPSHIP